MSNDRREAFANSVDVFLGAMHLSMEQNADVTAGLAMELHNVVVDQPQGIGLTAIALVLHAILEDLPEREMGVALAGVSRMVMTLDKNEKKGTKPS